MILENIEEHCSNTQLYRTEHAGDRCAGGAVGVSVGWGRRGGVLALLWTGCRGRREFGIRWGTFSVFFFFSTNESRRKVSKTI